MWLLSFFCSRHYFFISMPAPTFLTKLSTMPQVQSFFDIRNVYKNLGKPKLWIAELISKTILDMTDILIKLEYCKPDIVVLGDPSKRKLTITCRFSNLKRNYFMWFVVDPKEDPYDLTRKLFKHWFKDDLNKALSIEKSTFKNQADIDELTRNLLGRFDELMTDDKNPGPIKLVTKQSSNIEEDVNMHTKYGTTWYVGGNKPIIGRSSFISSGFAYLIT